MRFHTELEVNLNTFGENFHLLKILAPSNEIIFMIKANAYGHGLIEVAHYAWAELGIKTFGVASLGEALALRRELPSMGSEIFVFSDTGILFEELQELYTEFNIIPVIGNLEELETFLFSKNFARAPLVVKLDTGMNRLGLGSEEVENAINMIKRSGRSKIDHLMTHFSSSFLKSKQEDKTAKQHATFKLLQKQFEAGGVAIEQTSCANSGAIEQKIGLEHSHIRPGLMLYGPSSLAALATKGSEPPWSGKSVSSLKTRVLDCFLIKRGDPVGYGGHVSHKDGLLAYFPVGYGDGFLTYYSKMDIEVEGRIGRVLGRVNMDLTAILFDESAVDVFKRGKKVALWERDRQSVSRLAASAKTVPYQVFTSISSRVPRSYISREE